MLVLSEASALASDSIDGRSEPESHTKPHRILLDRVEFWGDRDYLQHLLWTKGPQIYLSTIPEGPFQLDSLVGKPVPDAEVYAPWRDDISEVDSPLSEDTFIKWPYTSVIMSQLDNEPANFTLAYQEIDIMERISKTHHPNIVEYRGCLRKGDLITGICLRKCPCTLHQAVMGEVDESMRPPYNPDVILSDIQAGLAFLHNLGLVHDDINPNNIMLDENGRGVIIDFDTCRPVGAPSAGGTPGWASNPAIALIENDEFGLNRVEQFMRGEYDGRDTTAYDQDFVEIYAEHIQIEKTPERVDLVGIIRRDRGLSTPYLYTVYESEDNLRLEQCPNCHEFVDPYVEHDALTILLDLLLLKRGVYRHLLYNNGAPPRRLRGAKQKEAEGAEDEVPASAKDQKELDRWILLFRLGSALVFLDAFVRSSYLKIDFRHGRPWTKEPLLAFLRVLLATAAETVAFHGGIILTCYIFMKLKGILNSWYQPKTPKNSSIREEFRLSLIPFSLFYSSITKLFLLFLLTVWLPTTPSSPPPASLPLPEWTNMLSHYIPRQVVEDVFTFLDDDKLDREWIVRNILGGMSAGFGLRVILDIPPVFTTFIILAGWAAKTAVSSMLSGWVGGTGNGEAWLAYSIP